MTPLVSSSYSITSSSTTQFTLEKENPKQHHRLSYTHDKNTSICFLCLFQLYNLDRLRHHDCPLSFSTTFPSPPLKDFTEGRDFSVSPTYHPTKVKFNQSRKIKKYYMNHQLQQGDSFHWALPNKVCDKVVFLGYYYLICNFLF